MAKPNQSDRDGAELFNAAMTELARGTWQADVPALEAALAGASLPEVRAGISNLLTHHHFTAGQMDRALAACEKWLAEKPAEISARDSKLSILLRLRRWDEVIGLARERLAEEGENHRLHSSLANAFARLGDLEAARHHGNEALVLQDRRFGGTGERAVPPPPAPFDPSARARNIVAFSLYGANPKYGEGMIRNAIAMHHVYPEWTCRVYHDTSVPAEVLRRLERLGAQLMTVDGLPASRFGTFWRFLVADDPGVDRFLVRDCDACVNLRERAAVEDWLASDRHFHLMRDGFTHTDLVLAGMWGGVRGGLPPIGPAMLDFARTAAYSRTADQTFLRERMWPVIRASHLTHDACYTALDAQPFPPRADLPGPRVGEAVSQPPVG